MFYRNIVDILQKGGVCVIPTDTLYGVVASAFRKDVVSRVYALRQRDLHKPCIVLIARVEDLEKFSVQLSSEEKVFLRKTWPGKVSVVLSVPDESFAYLHRGTKTIAFRLPEDRDLQMLLERTGPLIAPSANTQGNIPAKTVSEARGYFGDHVDAYVDGGVRDGSPSKLIRLVGNEWIVLRN